MLRHMMNEVKYNEDRLSEDELQHRARQLEEVSRDLFVTIWKQIITGGIPERSPIADITLILRDVLNPHWPHNPDWMPKTLPTER